MTRFDVFISQLKETNATLGFFTDFSKVSASVDKISVKLNQLNYLLGKEDLQAAVQQVFDENPKAFDVLGILVAVRNKDKKLEKQARLFQDNDIRVLREPEPHYAPELPF